MSISRASGLMAVGVVLTVAAVAVEMIADGEDALATDVWQPTSGQLAWTLALAVGTAAFVAGLWSSPDRAVAPVSLGTAWNVAARSGAAAIVATALVSPWFFDRIAYEDRPVEYLSALGCLAASGVFVRLAVRWAGWLRAGAVVVAVGLFFIGMEEISWFQRFLDFGTPSSLAERNDQTEANLHNVATDAFQNLYYAGTSVLFLALPVAHRLRGRSWPREIRRVVPGHVATTLAVLSVPFAYATSSYPAHHLSVWWAAALVVVWIRDDVAGARALAAQFLVSLVVIRYVGPDLPRDFSPSEYRELLLAGATLAWGLELLRRESARGGELVAEPPVTSG